MAYNDAIESLKNALNGYSEEEERIKELYAKAKSALAVRYAGDIAAADRDRLAKRAEAEADAKRQERNSDLMMAQRGLAFSGEAAQTRLDSALALNKRLAEIDALHAENRGELAKAQSENLLKTEAEEAKRTAEAQEGKNKILSEIAGLELKRESEQARAANAASAQGAAGSAQENEKIGYLPPVTAKALAEQIISSVSSKGYVSKNWEMEKIAEKLDSLKKGYEIDGDYLNDLIFTLRAYGYTEPERQQKSALDKLAEEAETYYRSVYGTNYASYQLAGFPENTADSRAKEKARAKLLEYIYDRVSDARDFRNVCTVLGISNAEANEYIESQRLKTGGAAESEK